MNPSRVVLRFCFTLLVIRLLVTATAAGADFWRSTRAAPHGPINAITIASDGTVFAGSDSGWVHISTDGGFAWRSVEVVQRPIRLLRIDPSGWLMAGLDSGLVCSQDNGLSWTSAGLKDREIFAIAGNGSGTVFAGTSLGVVSSTNEGTSWNVLPTVPGRPLSIAATSASVFAATDSGLYRRAGGKPWERIQPFKAVPQISGVSETTLFAVSQCDTGSMLFRSTDGGMSWVPVLDAPRAGMAVSMTPDCSKHMVMVSHWGRGRLLYIDYLLSEDLWASWRLTATRSDYAPSSVSLHPSGRVFLLVSPAGSG